jgi:hypothetical protein
MKKPSGPFADKLWRDAIRKAALEQAEAKRGPKKLELAARALVNAAITGDVSAAKEMGDRLDGKVPQAVTGEGGTGPVALAISWLQPST